MTTPTTGLALWTEVERAARRELYEAWALSALEPAAEKPLSEWAEENIELPATEPIPGALDLSRSPFLRGYLDLYSNPDVYHISDCKSTQVGGSLGIVCGVAYCVKHRKVPVMVVQPKRANAKSFNRSRVQPVFRTSKSLQGLLPTGRGNTDFEVQHSNGVKVRYATAGSPSDLAETSVPVIFNDEVDKYPRSAGTEADPIKLGQERLRWWNWTLQVDISTPTKVDGYIWRQLNAAPRQMRYYVKCPHCGTWQYLSFDGEPESIMRGDEEVVFPGPAGRINWPRTDKGHPKFAPLTIKDKRLAWYECGKCDQRWTERQKAEILAGGHWRTLNGKPPKGWIGVRRWAIMSPRLSFSDIAYEYLTSRGNPELEMNFDNSWLARPHRQKGSRPTMEALVGCRLGYSIGEVPKGVYYLTAGIDVHKELQYWSVWGWGAGFGGWLIAAGREDTSVNADLGWRRVFDAIAEQYRLTVGGGTLRVGDGAGVALVDSGWVRRQDGDPDENVNEAEVIDLCDGWNRKVGWGLFQPSKGASHPMAPRFIRWDGKSYEVADDGTPLKNRLNLHLFDPWFFKKTFYAKINQTGDVGAIHLPRNCPKSVLEQLMSEEMITARDGRETWKKTGQNHWFDTAIMAFAGMWRYRLRLEARSTAPDQKKSWSDRRRRR